MPRRKTWSSGEHETFVQAWEDVPMRGGESVRKHCDRIHERFAALCGGETSRSAQALYVHQSASTFNFKFIVEFEETHGAGSWFELSRRGREEVFLGSDHLSYPYIAMDQTMFGRIKRIRERTAAAADADTGTAAAAASSPPLRRRVTRQTSTDAPADVGARATEWSTDELLLLVRAWRAETKDAQLRSGEHTKFAANRSLRIYERFVTLCGGRTARTLAAVRTKQQDLAHSCDFILQFDAAQTESGKPTWYRLTKLQRLAVLRDINKPGHFTDIPENLCARIARALGTDHSARVRAGRDASVRSPRATHSDTDSARTKKQKRVTAAATTTTAAKKKTEKVKLQAQQQQQHDIDDGDDDGDAAPRSSPAPKKHKQSTSASELSPGHFADAYQELLDVAAGLEVQSHRVAELVRVLAPASSDNFDERRAAQRTARIGDRRPSRPDADGDATRRQSEAHVREERASRRPTLPATPGFGELVLQLQNQGVGQGASWRARDHSH